MKIKLKRTRIFFGGSLHDNRSFFTTFIDIIPKEFLTPFELTRTWLAESQILSTEICNCPSVMDQLRIGWIP